jgi:hypothetical protein
MFFCEPVLMLVPNTPRSLLLGVIITGESRLPGYSSPMNHFGHREVVIPILRSMQQSLKELSFYKLIVELKLLMDM